jgi:hypothetical protein
MNAEYVSHHIGLAPFPVGLQILVYDSDTGEEIGSRYWMRYTVQRLDYTRSMKYRWVGVTAPAMCDHLAKHDTLMMQPGNM